MKWFKRNKQKKSEDNAEQQLAEEQLKDEAVADEAAENQPSPERADTSSDDSVNDLANKVLQELENNIQSSKTANEASAEKIEIVQKAEYITPEQDSDRENTEQQQVPSVEEQEQSKGLFSRLKRGLGKTSQSFSSGIGALFLGAKEIDEDLLEEIEMQMIMADVGIAATSKIVTELTAQVERKELYDSRALYKSLQKSLHALLNQAEQPLKIDNAQHTPYVILMVGVNGAGKTTTIGKLAKRFQNDGKKVMLAAGDTFRAAAVEQLQVWGERNKVEVIAQASGSDSASVIYDGLDAAIKKNVDVLIADTAGRLHSQDNLMEELKKIVRVMKKREPSAPHEVMLVLDASTGQNAIAQAQHFQKAVGVTGITVTKLDGTAKGGVVFAISEQLKLPIRFIGVGEKVDDLRPFVADDFVRALFE